MKKRKVKRYDEGGGVFENIKEGLSRAFRRDDESKFSDLESVGGAGRRPKTIEEQIKGRPGRENEGKEYAPIRREPEPAKPEPRSTLPKFQDKTGTFAGIERDVMGVDSDKVDKVDKVDKAAKSIKSSLAAAKVDTSPSRPEANKKAKIDTSPSRPEANKKIKFIGADAKPLPGKVETKKEEAKPLPGKPEAKAKEPTPYSAPKKISKEEEAEGERGKRMEEEAAAQLKKNKEEAKTGVARTRAGTVVKPSREEPSEESKAKAMASLKEKMKKQYEQNKFNFSPSKSPNRSYKSGGVVSSASSRADGIAMRGKTRGKIY